MNTTKLKSVLCRAAAGEELTIGFLGGSITQGSLTTQPENTYAYRVYRWWCETFPQANSTMSTAASAVPTRCMGCPAL